jgi:hypothetical protein
MTTQTPKLDRAEQFLKCLGNGSGSPEQAYLDATPEEEGEEECQ